jgi:hypothetical protein
MISKSRQKDIKKNQYNYGGNHVLKKPVKLNKIGIQGDLVWDLSVHQKFWGGGWGGGGVITRGMVDFKECRGKARGHLGSRRIQ